MFSDSLSTSEITNQRPNDSAPINRVPPEILEHIFSLSIEDEDWYDWCTTSRLYFSWVCRSWRYVIINNPFFWSTIDYLGEPELVATSIIRSGESELRIDISDYGFECPKMRALIRSTLISEASRIEHIDTRLSSWNLQSIEEALCRPFPSLRHLSFYRSSDDELPLINSQIPFTLDISKLEAFEIDFPSAVPWNCLQAVVAKVRKLRINLDRPESVISFFGNIQSFNGLEILSIHCNLRNLPQLPTVALPNITALLIQDTITTVGLPHANPPPAPFFANHLRVPNLRHLVIYDCKGYSCNFHPDFDYTSIQYVSITATAENSTDFTFCITGSVKKDKPRNDWRSPYYESFLSNSSYEKQFQLMTYFHKEAAGFSRSFEVLNELLPKMPKVRELCLPSSSFLDCRLCHTLLHPDLMKHYPSLTGFQLIRRTSDTHVYGR